MTGPWHLYEKRPKLFEKQEFRREHLPPLDRYSSAHVGNAADSCIQGRYFFFKENGKGAAEQAKNSQNMK